MPSAGSADIEATMDRLAAGFAAWTRTPPASRAALLRRAADALDARLPEFCALLVKEAHVVDCGTIGDAADAERWVKARAAKEGIAVERAKTDLLAEKQPSLEFATPEQIGALAVFLCLEAAAQIRGAALPVDGGWLAQ